MYKRITEFFFMAPFFYFVYLLIRIAVNNNYLIIKNIFKVHLKAFLFCQLSFHVHFILKWIPHLKGNPYRSLYGDLNPLTTPFYIIFYFLVHLVFAFIVFYVLKGRGLTEEKKLWRSSGFRFVLYWFLAFFIQFYIATELSDWKGISLVSETPVESVIEKDKFTFRPKDTLAAEPRGEEIADENFSYPPYTFYEMKILGLGMHHGDEVYANAEKENWIALIKSKNGYSLQKTNIKLEKVHDEIIDNPNEKTGIKILSDIKTNNFVQLIAGVNLTEQKNVAFVELTQNEIYPEDDFKFTFKEKTFRMFATGKTIIDKSGVRSVSKYRLYLENETGIIQLLAAATSFDEKMLSINFIGDIDGDNLPDFILDTSNHYNRTSATLYLSSNAEKGKMVKVVAMHNSTGC